MELDAIQDVRRFNRTVTQRIGALNDRYLARGRPLGASRVLWEVGDDGVDVRSLRARLDLDSGYLSRLLRALEHDGLVNVAPADTDRRVRIVRLTKSGRAERVLLDRRSDELAWSLLAPLADADRQRLREAMMVVERLLTAGMVELAIEDPTTVAAKFCIDSYFAELNSRFESGFDPAQSVPFDVGELTEPIGLLVIARLHGEPIGCGALRFHDDEPAEIKRVWLARTARGFGLGRRLLGHLEELARERGVRTLRLDTNRALTEAINLYRSTGYREIPRYNDEPYAHHWFEKAIF